MSMRVTTRMVNQAAERAGIPVNQNSLLNYINNDNSMNLVEALNKKTEEKAAKSVYEKMQTAAEELSEKASIFTVTGAESLFEKAKQSGDNQEIYTGVEDLVEKFNDTIKALSSSTTTLDAYYKEMLTQAAKENSEALSSIGITMTKSGTLSLDTGKLKEADLETLEKVLGSESTFTKKTAFVAGRVADNAKTSMQSLTNQYNASGSIYSGTQTGSRFDSWQ